MHKKEREEEEEEEEVRKWSGKVEHGGARLPHRFTQGEVNAQCCLTYTLPFKLIHRPDTGTHHFTQR